ncbi:sulfotransferase [Aequorivita marisscotiae]|uniref:Sulfotransferase n=1 Tax=Aequorivita marisscotiae TaxID=3040348 RepID=A0ABY8KWV5_9FLAO|nr:sulfotransferase [Aequorivita sp. Ant34-E75]WGF92217.1 sulfotransferase [Aequorivita sp. Ant34-E75]
MSEKIIPVFIIGAARNGTTSLTNIISDFSEIVGIEHELHRGNHEAKLYGNYAYHGDISKPDKYIDFLYHYASGDYFQLAEGNLEFHLENPRNNFFEFYFDMMNHCCHTLEKGFWMAKLDSAFFTDSKTFEFFLRTLYEFYDEVKFIRIQRDFEPALISAQFMPGKNHARPRKGLFKYYGILGYTQQWFKTYLLKTNFLNDSELLHIRFDDLINDKQKVQNKIRSYLGLSKEFALGEPKPYTINTSFSKHKKSKMSKSDRLVAYGYLSILKTFPSLAIIGQYINQAFLKRKPIDPIDRRLLKRQFFKEHLKVEFNKLGTFGLAEKMSEELQKSKKS